MSGFLSVKSGRKTWKDLSVCPGWQHRDHAVFQDWGYRRSNTVSYENLLQGRTAVSMAGMTTEPAGEKDRRTGTGLMAAVRISPNVWIALVGVIFYRGRSFICPDAWAVRCSGKD